MNNVFILNYLKKLPPIINVENKVAIESTDLLFIYLSLLCCVCVFVCLCCCCFFSFLFFSLFLICRYIEKTKYFPFLGIFKKDFY